MTIITKQTQLLNNLLKERMSRKNNLCRMKIKLPPLQLIPDVHMFDELPIKLQPRYNQKREKNKKIKELLEEKAMTVKRKMAKTRIIDADFDFMPFPQEKYINDLRNCASEIVPTPMVKSCEIKILRFIPRMLKNKFPKVLLDFMAECKKEWNKCVHELLINTTIKGEHHRICSVILPFKFAGRTQNYANFLKTKSLLEEKLITSHPLMRFIKETSVKILPEFILDFSRFSSKNGISIGDLKEMINKDIVNAEDIVTNMWYPQIVSYLKESKKIARLPQRKKLKLLTSASNLISSEITEMMRRSINYLIWRTSNEEFMPSIYISLECTSEIVLKPTFIEIFSMFHDTINSISNICQWMQRLEVVNDFTNENSFIKVVLSQWISEDSHQKIQNNLEKIYSPIQAYVASLNKQYVVLISPKTLESITDDIKFDDGCREVKIFKNIKENLLRMLDNEYFTLGQVNQVVLLQQLKDKSDACEHFILNILCNFHININKNICSEFDVMATKVSAVPKNPSELMESGAYCNQVKTVLVDELRERICESILLMSKLFEMTGLTEEHILLNANTVNWLTNIEPLIEQNAITFENCKYEMEENLIQKTNVLMGKISDIVPHLEILDEMDDINNTLDYLEDIERLVLWLDDCDNHVSMINDEEAVFKFPLSQYSELDELKNYILPFYNLMYLLHKWRRCYSKWMDGPFEYINNKDVEVQHEVYWKEFTAISKSYKNKIKQQISDGIERRFKGLVEDPDPMNLPAPMKLCAQALNELKEFQPNVRLVNIMCNPALRQRHWDEMSSIANQDLTPDAGTTIRKLVALDIWAELEKYEIISIGACKELILKTELDKMISEWDDILFETTAHEETDMQIIVKFDEIQETVQNHEMKTIGMQGSAFVKPFEIEVNKWYAKLNRMNLTISLCVTIQEKWLYYLPFFSIPEIKSQMNHMATMFDDVDKIIKKYINKASLPTVIIDIVGQNGSLVELTEAHKLLEEINFGVQKYLDVKRSYFPRFFLMSDDEVFKILSQNDFKQIQQFIKKLFNGIYRFEYDDEAVTGIWSEKDEMVRFTKQILPKDCKGCNEQWLLRFEEQMKTSIQSEIKSCILEYQCCDIKKWSSRWQQMIAICVFQLWWTEQVENILLRNNNDMKSVSVKIQSHLNDLINNVRDADLESMMRIKLENLISTMSYAEKIVCDLTDQNITNCLDFNWLIQLRYYMENNNISLKMMESIMKYGYEYVGNTDNFIITSLTERCYRTLLEAFKLHVNGALEGPGATGKTESIKNLATSIAIPCVIFNCSDSLDANTVSRILRGIVSIGAFVCFDEINRINVEVLSVVGQQISSIVQAKRKSTTKFILNGNETFLNSMCLISYTINPEYVGRCELPYNLKMLFRVISMNAPDTIKIAEVFLYSIGFVDYKSLSLKIISIHKLCCQLLKHSHFYDFGLRSVKSVLSACRFNKIVILDDKNENRLVLKSLKDVIQPKLLSNDKDIFQGILQDLFPHEALCLENDFIFKNKCAIIAEELNFQLNDEIISKLLQVYNMILIRHGIIFLGDPFSGKSSLLKILSKVYTDVDYKFINPKIFKVPQLFGKIHPISGEWEDGLISKYFRRYSLDQSEKKKWLIFDGPIESNWIENMNTVLDDNKRLCLSSKEIIFMNDRMSMMFEVLNLDNASPATISRCGIVCLKYSAIGVQGFVKSWMNRCNKKWISDYESMLENLSNILFPVALLYVKQNCFQYLPHSDIRLVFSCLNLLSMVMNDAVENEDDSKFFKSWIQASFILCLIWGIGGVLDSQSKEKFDDYMKTYLRDERNFSESVDKIEITIPVEGLLFDYVYQYKQKGSFKMWQDFVKSSKLIERDEVKDIVVPTLETIKCNYLLDLHIKYKMSILFIGPVGIGKNFYVRDYFKNQMQNGKCNLTSITFTALTNADETQKAILSKLTKKGNTYNSPKKVSLIYIDDLNLPMQDVSGTQVPIEFLRQCIDHEYFFDPQTKFQMNINDNVFIATMGPEDGIKKSTCTRFLKHFNIFSMNYFSEDTIYKIFSNILQIGMKRSGFGNDAAPSILAMVSGTWNILQYMRENLQPVENKWHYIFSLKDFFRVMQGCMLIKKESADNKRILNRLWIHEILRVFADRLVDIHDRQLVFQKIECCTKEYFRDNLNDVCENFKDQNSVITHESLNNLMFGTYFDVEFEGNEKKYEEVMDMEKLQAKIYETLQVYNSREKLKLNIVIFKSAIEHISKICRVLSIPGENALLIGINGSGKKSLVKIGSTMLDQKIFQPRVSDAYDIYKWENDLKHVLKTSGGLGNEIVFLLDESLLQNDVYLEYVAKLLNCGEISNLFKSNEEQEILEMVRLDAQGGNRNLDVSPEEVFSYFVKRYKKKMHTCICISPVGKIFLSTIRNFPSLLNSCTINWYNDWPEDALVQIAQHYIQDVDLPETIKSLCIETYIRFHRNAIGLSEKYKNDSNIIKTYITSNSYMDMIKSFAVITTKKQDELREAKEKYISGLEKLELAAEAVSNMQQELNELKPQLIIMAVKGTEMMEEIEHETVEAAKATKQVRVDEKIANEQAAAAQLLKKDCEADLALAIPILEDAIAALNTLKPTDITVVKSMKNPPAAIKLVMAAVCVMKSIPPDKIPDPTNPGRKMYDFWGPSKRLLGDMGFLQNLKEYDKDNIPPTIMAKIRKEYLPHKDFKPQIIAKASTAAEGLCKWVIAMDMYDAVAKVVAPKKAKLQAAELEFATTMEILEEKKAMVARLEKKVADLHAALEEANLKKQQLEDEVEMCINKLHRAEKLIGGLGGEKSRWTSAAENLQLLYDSLAGDILLSCAIITYLPTFPTAIREPIIKEWRNHVIATKIPNYEQFSFAKVLATGTKIQNWHMAGLPNDKMSVDNAVIQESSIKWSLLIDPQGQANKWIKELEKNNNLIVTKLNDPDYIKLLKKCVLQGLPILIENISETLSLSLDPVLKKLIYVESNKKFIVIDDGEIEYNNEFRLYMTTKLKKPSYQPDVYDKVTLINFSLTITGLGDQLLKIITAKERPDLEELREKIVNERAKYKAELKALETSILNTLHESQGDILDDESAIEVLDSSKLLSGDILKKQLTIKDSEFLVNEFRQKYEKFANHSATLYYCTTELVNINPMYVFSLNWFTNLFIKSIDSANKSKNLERRLKFLKDNFTCNLYANVCRAIFESDRLLFSFVLCCKILIMNEKIAAEEFEYLLKYKYANTIIERENKISWLSQDSWNELNKLEKLDEFHGFVSNFVENSEYWKTVYESLTPYKEKFPFVKSDFQRLLVLNIIRPDLFLQSVEIFIKENLGEEFVGQLKFNLRDFYRDSNCLIPLIIISSPGYDVMTSLQKFSKIMGYKNKFHCVSLGENQQNYVEDLINRSQSDGSWVCLQNCHLADSWIFNLEGICDNFDLSQTDRGFRLWLISNTTLNFPQSLLQIGIKMIKEPSPGLKNDLHECYTSQIMEERFYFEGCPGKDKLYSKFLYCLRFFHALIRERSKYGSLGWNAVYNFDDLDFTVSVIRMQEFINASTEIPYQMIQYFVGQCFYGGRITNERDWKLLNVLLNDFINKKVVEDPDFSFSETADEYRLPKRFECEDYIKHISFLPNSTSPEILGLHKRVQFMYNVKEYKSFHQSLDALYGNIKTNNFVDCFKNIIEKTPGILPLDKFKERFPIEYKEPTNAIYVQEVIQFNKLITTVNASLNKLVQVVNGLRYLTPSLQKDKEDILNEKAPKSWTTPFGLKFSRLSNFILHINEQWKMLNNLGNGNKIWLPGFFNPEGLLVSIIQKRARENNININDLKFECCFNGKRDCELYIAGLFLQCANWNFNISMIEDTNSTSLFHKMPTFGLVIKKTLDTDDNIGFRCPLYRVRDESEFTRVDCKNFITYFTLPTDKPSSYWIKRSVALLLHAPE